jgi:general secretion pathway protein M
MLSRWRQLNGRDQAMLALLGAVLLLYVSYLALWRPLAAANRHLRQQNLAAADSLGAVTQLAAQYRELQKNQGAQRARSENLTQLIDRSVAANQLHMSRFQPGSGGDVQVRLDNAPFDQVLRWLYQLESAEAVTIRELAVAPGAGSGLVNVSVRLYRL